MCVSVAVWVQARAGGKAALGNRTTPLVSEMVHPRGLDFENQRKVMILRDHENKSWDDIAAEVVNLSGDSSTRDTVKRVYERSSKN